MTCDEFRRLTNGRPENATRAERVAVARHHTDCATCQNWFEHQHAAELARTPPLVQAINYFRGVALGRECAGDPELKDQITKIREDRREKAD